jgi:hypothetical protein
MARAGSLANGGGGVRIANICAGVGKTFLPFGAWIALLGLTGEPDPDTGTEAEAGWYSNDIRSCEPVRDGRPRPLRIVGWAVDIGTLLRFCGTTGSEDDAVEAHAPSLSPAIGSRTTSILLSGLLLVRAGCGAV